MIITTATREQIAAVAAESVIALSAAPIVGAIPVLALVIERMTVTLLRINRLAAIDGAVGHAISVNRFAGRAEVINVRLFAGV